MAVVWRVVCSVTWNQTVPWKLNGQGQMIAHGDPTISSALNSRLKLPNLDFAFVIFTLLEEFIKQILKKKILFPYCICWKPLRSYNLKILSYTYMRQ